MVPKWYPWNKSLGNNERIHDYLDKNGLRKFIPQKFTYPKNHPEEVARREKRREEKRQESSNPKKKTKISRE